MARPKPKLPNTLMVTKPTMTQALPPNSQAKHPQDEALLHLLRLAEPDVDASQMADRVMADVLALDAGEVLRAARPAVKEASAFAANVMAQISGAGDAQRDGVAAASQPHVLSRPQPRRPRVGLLTVMRYAAVSAASVLLALVIALPSTNKDGTTGHVAEVQGITGGPTTAAETLTAQVRRVDYFDGRRCAVIDAGLIRGVRIGDHFLDQEGRALEVIGVAPFTAVCALPSGRVKRGGFVEFGGSTAAVRESQQYLRLRQPLPGAFFGLGARFQQSDNGWVASEVFGEYWYEQSPRAEATLAARLGLRRGDRLLEINGRVVQSEEGIEGALVRTGPDREKLVLLVERDGVSIALADRAESILPSGR